jgi:hypothetical protein
MICFYNTDIEQTSKVPFLREAIIPNHHDKSNPGLHSPPFSYGFNLNMELNSTMIDTTTNKM